MLPEQDLIRQSFSSAFFVASASWHRLPADVLPSSWHRPLADVLLSSWHRPLADVSSLFVASAAGRCFFPLRGIGRWPMFFICSLRGVRLPWRAVSPRLRGESGS